MTTPTRAAIRSIVGWRLATLLFVAILVRVPFALAVVHQPGFAWPWGGEQFQIAHAIALGHGFASPYGGATGPTAQQVPIFPYLVAGLATVGGSMDAAVRLVLALNVLWSSLTALVLVAIGNRVRSGAGLVAGWCWALAPIVGFPNVVYLWDTALYVLVLTVLAWALLATLERPSSRRFALWGLAVGASLLLDPAHVVVVTAVIGLLAFTHRVAWRHALVAGTMAVLVVAPWCVRNSVAFHRPTFIRSNAGYEMYKGLATSPFTPGEANALNPGRNPAAFAAYQSLGESRFFRERGRLADSILVHHPTYVARRVIERAAVYWLGDYEVRSHLLFALPVLLAFAGFVVAWRAGVDRVALGVIATVVVLFPAPYYLTLTMPRYRAPMKPLFALLAAAWLWPVVWLVPRRAVSALRVCTRGE